MLELIQQRFQTVVLVILVFMLAAVFVLQFGGPQADGCTTSINQTGFAARVYGETITEGDFRAAYAVTGFTRYPTKNARTLRLRELTVDGLVERELLAHEAETLGYRIEGEDVVREFAETAVVYVSPPVDAPAGYPGPEIDASYIHGEDGHFSMTKMQRFVNDHLRRSTEEFAHWQTRERLANRMRETVLAEVTVSNAEVHDAYIRETDRARFRYAQFRPEFYEENLHPTDEDITTWMAAHTEEVDAEYERQSFRYRDLEPQAHVRHILIRVAEDASDEDRAAARARIDGIRVRLLAGEDFAAVARAESDDPGSASNGGEYDWTPRGRWVAPFEEAAFTQEVGAIGEVVETDFGYHILKVEGRREGDVPEADAKRELAQGLYMDERAGALAREEADRALAFLREGNSLDELDERLLHRWEEVVVPAPVEGEGAPTEAVPAEAVPAEAVPAEPEERAANAPQVAESRSFGRTESPITGAGSTGALTRAAYELTLDDPLPAEPIQVGTDWFVIQLTERTEATEEGFTAEVRERISQNLLEEKRAETLRVYVHALRTRAEEAGALRVDERILLYGDEVAEDEEEESEEEDEGEEGEEDESEEGSEDEEAEPAEEESALPVRRSEVPA
jgi:peptidyl-prolyl cis-trans isomerase D